MKKTHVIAGCAVVLAAVCLLAGQLRQVEQPQAQPTVAATQSPQETQAPLEPDKTRAAVLDYTEPDNWAFWADASGLSAGTTAVADIFLIAPTVGMGRDGELTLDLDSEKNRAAFVGALNMERGIYDGAAVLYAPYYRQVTFPVYSLPADERTEPLETAYRDVEAAFLCYLEQSEPGTPLILAGFSQGSQHLLRLMEEYFDDPAYQNRLVAAYCIGWPVTPEDLTRYPHLQMAQGEEDVGVIVSFNSEAPDAGDSLVVPEGTKSLGINPLSWSTDSLYADKSRNPGACLMNRDGTIKEELPGLTGAYLDPERGTLKLPDLDPADWHSSLFPDGVYHLYDYQFFYRSLQQNVAVRTQAYLAQNADRPAA